MKFLNKDYMIYDYIKNDISLNYKIGIHIHIYYTDMISIFFNYLKDSPVYFDLYISVVTEEAKILCEDSFNLLDKLKKLSVKICPNIGRDIAPWIVEFKEEQKNYDFFCHIHSKKTVYNSNLNKWSEYLFNNLISRDAMINIINYFIKDESVGVICPPVYGKVFPCLFSFSPNSSHDLLYNGTIYNDARGLANLLSQMNIKYNPRYCNFIFPTGTMLWYRPKALYRIFDLNLQYSDFPEEPIPETGTIAHSLERSISIAAEYSGYKTKFYLTLTELINSHFEYYILFKEINELQYEINKLQIEKNDLKYKAGWFSIFNIYNNNSRIKIVIFGIKIIIKLKPSDIDKIARFIPTKKLKESFRQKFL